MKIRPRRPLAVLGITVALVLAAIGPGRHMLSETEAAWTDSEYVAGTVGSGSWVASGYGLGSAARVNSAGGVSILPTNPTPLPWNGARIGRDSTNPGTSTVSGGGPFATSAVANVNRLEMSGSTAGTVVGASACGSYVGGVVVPTYCSTGSTPLASASSAVTSLRVSGSILGLLGVGLVNTSIVSISGAQALSASVSCNLVAGTNTWTQPRVTAASGNGSVVVGGAAVAIPNANAGPTVVTSIVDGLVGYSNVRLTSTASATNTPNGFTKLNLTGSVSLLSLGVLALTFDIDLVAAECGTGNTPVSAAAAQPMARGAAQTTSATTTSLPSANTETAAPTTTPSPSGTSSSAEAAVTTRTPPTTTDTAELVPTPEPTIAPEPPVIAEPPETVFTGPTDGNVEALTLEGGTICRVPAEADYSGTVELSCSDGTSLDVLGSELTPDGVASATVDGVWTPRLTTGDTAKPVVSAARS